jgi:hypothetical protein
VLISGAGNTTVVFLSTPISTRLRRFRGCRASGWVIIVSDAAPRDRGHVDADVVAGDDALGLDRHRYDPQRHPVQHVDERDDHSQPRVPQAADAAEPEQHPLLVLLDDLQRHRQPDQDQHRDDDNNDDQRFHGKSLRLRPDGGLP